VGHYTNPADLIDQGFTGTPNLAFYSTDGKWEIENHGVAPDVMEAFAHHGFGNRLRRIEKKPRRAASRCSWPRSATPSSPTRTGTANELRSIRIPETGGQL
jgi:hypothetical protein